MTQNTKMQKTKETQTHVFVQNCKVKINGNICALFHYFWSNQNVDLLSTSKWPSEPQFCERWTYILQKMARKGRTKVIYKGTFICIQTLGSLMFVDISPFFISSGGCYFGRISWYTQVLSLLASQGPKT